MKTEIEKLNLEAIDDKIIAKAAAIIRDGGLVAFPTETVYGLGADAMQASAAKKIYEAKGRPSDNPLIVHIADVSALRNLTDEVPGKAVKLAKAFWPGPLTMIVKKSAAVPYETTGGMDTVAVRMPNHPIALALIAASGTYIAAPSANTSGRPSPTAAEHVMTDLNEKIPLILDGGSVGIGIESTIIDLTEETPMILRPGYITQEMLEEVIGEVHVDPGLIASDSLQKPKAPGMKYRHYAPKADLTVVTGEKKDVIGTINYLSHTGISQGKKIGIIATDETAGEYRCGDVISIGAREDEDAIARHLYGILRKFDDLDVDTIYSESFESEGLGQAIMNRLLKAAGHHVLQAVQEKKMKAYDRIIFAEDGGTCRAPMAAGILEEQVLNRPVEVLSRGLVALFPEPLNQKAEAVMISNGLKPAGFMSEQITEEDITDNTLILTMSEESRQKIFELFPNVEKEDVAVLTEFVGDELEILNPYGGNLQAYGICYETLNKSIKKLVKILNEGEEKCQK